MIRKTWIKQRRWLLGGLLLAALALAVILTIWATQAHQYQLALAQYTATHQPILVIHQLPDGRTLPETVTPPGHPPVDLSGPGAWGWIGWTLRLLAIFVPALLAITLDWRQQHRYYMRIHKTHLDHTTSRLAEAIVANQSLPEGVFDAYSKLRELESQPSRSVEEHQGPKQS